MNWFKRHHPVEDDGWKKTTDEEVRPRVKYSIESLGLKIEIDTFINYEWRIFCKLQGMGIYAHNTKHSLEAAKEDALKAAEKLSALGAINRW